MLRGLARIMILHVACGLAACSGPHHLGPAATLEPTQTRRTIGVLSHLGDTFSVQTTGITVFGNDLHTTKVRSWGYDDIVHRKLAADLASHGDVKRIQYDPQAFAEYFSPTGIFRNHDEELKAILKKVTAGQPCDVYIVVLPAASQVANTNQVINGIGILKTSYLVGPDTHVHALFQMRIYDGKTLAYKSIKRGTIGQGTFMMTIRGPHRPIDRSTIPPMDRIEAIGRCERS